MKKAQKEQLDAIVSILKIARGSLGSLCDEVQESFDKIPEYRQETEKYYTMEEEIDNMSDAVDAMDEAIDSLTGITEG